MGKILLTKEDCEKWKKTPNKNPKTNYTLKENSKLLQEIKETCDEILKEKPPKTTTQQPNLSPKRSQQHIENQKNLLAAKQSPKHDNTVNSFELHYPDLDDVEFSSKIANIKDFNIHKVPEYPIIKTIEDFSNMSNKLCGIFEKSYYQHFISRYISYRSPYRSILLYHGVGVGKTCSAITLSESFLIPHNSLLEPKIWVIMPHALKSSFKNQIFDIDYHTFETLANQCTGDTYIKLLNISKSSFNDKNKLKLNLSKLLKSRYRLFTYDAFAKFVQNENAGKIIKDKVIIVDEAHNIRSTDKEDKDVFVALKEVLKNGINNRLILLSATPMYNEPRDILDLFQLMLVNDKRFDIIEKNKDIFENLSLKIDANVLKLIKQLCSTYVSYLKGHNPFTFALKLSPKYSNIPLLEKTPSLDPFGKNIPLTDKNWINNIDVGVVPSILGEMQKHIVGNFKDLEENNIFNNLQPMNIVYGDDIGENGFYTFFSKAKDTDPLCVKYNKNYMNALMPDEQHLGKYSGKFLNICNFIKKSEGIVVIYSRYRWSGIIPLAICLEHLGYSREGANNILDKAEIIKNPAKYNGVSNPKYCILSSENKDIMGTTTIDTLIKKINSPENINGSLIKVILITPVASEGLSFYNTREIHLIEPWYHFNKAVQIIGRGIRNCRHQQLPFAEKNVTVFMHASVNDNENNESIDLHALRISTRKYSESNEIDNIINNNSLDCALMKNINFFPKHLFKLGSVPIKTSQGITTYYQFGDDDKLEPTCAIRKLNLKQSNYRRDTYKHLIINTQNILRKFIIEEIRNNKFYVSIENLIQNIEIDDKILFETIRTSIFPNVLIDGYTIIPHEYGLHIMQIKNIIPQKLNIVFDDKKDVLKIHSNHPEKENIDLSHIKLDIENMKKSTISLYSSLDVKTFLLIVQQILKKDVLDETLEYIANCLYIQGVLIKHHELPLFANNSLFIGYVNIFNLKNNFDVILYNKNDNKYRDANDKEKNELINNRKKYNDIPEDMSLENMPWGAFIPKKLKDKEDIINVFKLFTSGESAGKKTGIDCTSLKKDEHLRIFEEIGIRDIDGTKIQNCTEIANELLIKERMTLLPLFKPHV